MNMALHPTRDASPPLVLAFLLAANAPPTLPLNASSNGGDAFLPAPNAPQRYHPTLALMGATRLASEMKAKAHRQVCI